MGLHAKPLIATTLRGLFIKSEPWKVAHLVWFEAMAEKLGDQRIKELAHQTNYFKHVDALMKKAYPKLSEQQRTIKAREMFFDSVCASLEENPTLTNEACIDYFFDLKATYRIALITSNTKDAVDKILRIIELDNFFDIIECSLPNEKDDKLAVFERFVKKHGKPLLYIGGERKDSYDYCNQLGIPALFANLEHDANIPGVESITSLEELQLKIAHL